MLFRTRRSLALRRLPVAQGHLFNAIGRRGHWFARFKLNLLFIKNFTINLKISQIWTKVVAVRV